MSPEKSAKEFASWLIVHTTDVDTLGPCRRYKNKVLNVDELYDAWLEYKLTPKKVF